MIRSRPVVAATMVVGEAVATTRTSQEPLESAVRDHPRLVYRVAYSILRNHHDAQEAVQERFVRALRHAKNLGEIQDVQAWLAHIAWRIAVNRRPKSFQVALGDLEQASQALPSSEIRADEVVLGTQLSLLLEPMIAALPAKLRDPLVLSTIEELSPRDIARVLGIGEAAVRSRLFWARQILREKLALRLEGRHGT
jgi:RNA polymerase sigma-70 factor (ECF subfamily)